MENLSTLIESNQEVINAIKHLEYNLINTHSIILILIIYLIIRLEIKFYK